MRHYSACVFKASSFDIPWHAGSKTGLFAESSEGAWDPVVRLKDRGQRCVHAAVIARDLLPSLAISWS